MARTKGHGSSKYVCAALASLLLASGISVRARASTTEEDDNNFREDVILCEEAVSHFAGCCHLAVQSDACRYYHFKSVDSCGCSGGSAGLDSDDVRPVLSSSESRRVTATECSDLDAPQDGGETECARLYDRMQRENESRVSYAKRCN